MPTRRARGGSGKALRQIAERVVERAVKRGAKQAEAYLETQRDSSVRVRGGAVEDLTQSTSRGLGLRLIRGQRLGFAYTSDLSQASLDALVDRALALAKVAAPDPANRLPAATDLGARNRRLELFDPAVADLSTEWKIEAALTMERAGRAVDRRVANFESVGAGDQIAEVAIASSEGLSDYYRSSAVVLYSMPVAQDDDGRLQTGYWIDYRRSFEQLQPAEAIGRIAAERSLRMLGAERGPTCRVPVVMEPLQAAGFFGGLLGALNGKLVYQNASFLAGRLGQRIAAENLDVVDDGLIPMGLGSSPFDGEGLATRRTPLIEGGELKRFLYDTYSAHKAKARSSATASRGYQSLPSIGATNILVESSRPTPAAEIVRGVKRGLYVTAMLGRGADTVTGDYSRGANGIWIENGELTRPVHEITVAGSLLEMLGKIDAIGDDQEFRGSIAAPTIRFSELTVSGA
jgi:PmbA protein